MKTSNTALPLTVAEQAALLSISKNHVRFYEQGLRIPKAGWQEKLDQLYQTWNAIRKSDKLLFPLIDTLHTKTQARYWLQQQQTLARHKNQLLRAKLERMRCFFRPVPDKLVLVQRLLKEANATVYNLTRLKKMEARLIYLTDLYGPVRQGLVRHEMALAAYTDQLVTETLKRL